MQRTKVLNLLKKHIPILYSQYGVRHLFLFGSTARDKASAKSDVDVLVEFNNSPTFDGFMNLKFFLEDTLHTQVDLVTKDSLRPQLKTIIEKEIIHVA